MVDLRASAIAPSAIFPVALTFFAARSCAQNDPRELVVSPLSAAALTFVSYPLAFGMFWLVGRLRPQAGRDSPVLASLFGAVLAETCFFALVAPFWERGYSDSFVFALVAACGVATTLLHRRVAAGTTR